MNDIITHAGVAAIRKARYMATETGKVRAPSTVKLPEFVFTDAISEKDARDYRKKQAEFLRYHRNSRKLRGGKGAERSANKLHTALRNQRENYGIKDFMTGAPIKKARFAGGVRIPNTMTRQEFVGNANPDGAGMKSFLQGRRNMQAELLRGSRRSLRQKPKNALQRTHKEMILEGMGKRRLMLRRNVGRIKGVPIDKSIYRLHSEGGWEIENAKGGILFQRRKPRNNDGLLCDDFNKEPVIVGDNVNTRKLKTMLARITKARTDFGGKVGAAARGKRAEYLREIRRDARAPTEFSSRGMSSHTQKIIAQNRRQHKADAQASVDRVKQELRDDRAKNGQKLWRAKLNKAYKRYDIKQAQGGLAVMGREKIGAKGYIDSKLCLLADDSADSKELLRILREIEEAAPAPVEANIR